MTDTPEETDRCPSCGKPLPDDAPAGACPHCLLAAGLSSGPAPDGGPTPEVAEIADRFPALEVLEVLGRGGMGIVYKARQKNLDRPVALKVVAPLEGDQAAFAERFSREARTMARLDHPHIVRVYDFGETDGLFYLVMEYVEGVNLRQAMQAGQLEPQAALAIVPQVCDALQYAHDQGVVHRDIKPENILLDQEGSVKIADFGLAKLLNPAVSDHTITNTGQVMGTFQYMAPEQYKTPGEVDHRADIFSLGVVFYEMLTGELPVGRFARPSERVSVDVRLDEVVLRTLEQERERRYQHASEIRTRIDSIAGDPSPAPPPIDRDFDDNAWEDEDREPPRTSRMAVAGGLAVPGMLVLGMLIVLAMRLLMPEDAPVAIVSILSLAAVGGMAVGFVLSLVSWIRIGASNGRLRGLGYAITGTILPVLLGLFLVPLLLFVMMPVAEPIEEPWMISSEYGVGIGGGMDPHPVPPREPVPWPEPTAESNARPVVTVGRLTPHEHAAVRKAVTARLLFLTESLDAEPLDAADLLKLYGSDAESLLRESADPRDLLLLRGENRAGLPLHPLGTLPMPLKDYRITKIEVAPDGTTAKVTAWAKPRHTLRFGMIKQQGDWWFAFGPVELE